MSFIASVTDESVDLSSFIPVIKVIGVGGAGGNAIANIMSLEGVQCVIANTDAQSLVLSPCKNRIQLGRTLTAGLGAGALPEIGKKAALESKDEIMEFLKGTNMYRGNIFVHLNYLILRSIYKFNPEYKPLYEKLKK